jgi:glycyl-tRNA synthetase beta chain
MPSEFYMEIGCEEIPARTMARSLNDLRDRVEKLLQEEKLTYDRVEAIGSARRFVVRVPALAERQESRNERIMGPPASIAFKDGQPAPPLVGFAKKNNVAVEALQKFATDKGEYYGIESTIEGGSAADILAKGLPAIVRAMTFPKMMISMDHLAIRRAAHSHGTLWRSFRRVFRRPSHSRIGARGSGFV